MGGKKRWTAHRMNIPSRASVAVTLTAATLALNRNQTTPDSPSSLGCSRCQTTPLCHRARLAHGNLVLFSRFVFVFFKVCQFARDKIKNTALIFSVPKRRDNVFVDREEEIWKKKKAPKRISLFVGRCHSIYFGRVVISEQPRRRWRQQELLAVFACCRAVGSCSESVARSHWTLLRYIRRFQTLAGNLHT